MCQILDAMNQDSELPLARLRVDGGMTENDTLLQLQADLLGIPVGEEGGEGGGGRGGWGEMRGRWGVGGEGGWGERGGGGRFMGYISKHINNKQVTFEMCITHSLFIFLFPDSVCFNSVIILVNSASPN